MAEVPSGPGNAQADPTKLSFDSHTVQPGLTGLHTKHKSNRRKWVSPKKLQTVSNSDRHGSATPNQAKCQISAKAASYLRLSCLCPLSRQKRRARSHAWPIRTLGRHPGHQRGRKGASFILIRAPLLRTYGDLGRNVTA